ncbi:hypothetical protein KY284_024079 [Solanum tuberosum]|nr:hypothetical protein KY284_024079 [Solanum tuberosum]
MEEELRKYLKIEEEYWKQKAGMKWFMDGDRTLNSSTLMLNEEGKRQPTVYYFSEQFKADETSQDYSMQKHTPKMITEEENEEMIKLPTQEEIKRVVFELNGESVSGPDDFSDLFF